jgi:hypothetical protein
MRMAAVPGFFGRAHDIRSLFEERVGPSREGSESRFAPCRWRMHNREELIRETRLPSSESRSVVVLPLG